MENRKKQTDGNFIRLEVIHIQYYDFEIFKYDWLVVLCDYQNKKFKTIFNSVEELNSYYEVHKNDIWIGFNNKKYDQYIFKGILTGHSPYEISKHIIQNKSMGFTYSKDFNSINMCNYDVYNTLVHGLKFYEGSMGDSIEESSVDFSLNRKLTDSELKEVEKYCRHDVEETIKIFFMKKEDFIAQLGLVKLCDSSNINLMGRTQTQLSSIILNATPQKFDDEFSIDTPTILKLKKYDFVREWYEDPDNMNYDKHLETDIAGVPHTFAFGGLHGALEKYHYKGDILVMDVASLYPSLMINYDLLSRAVKDKNIYKELRDKRLQYKKDKNPLQLPLKLVLNKTYGAMKDKSNNLYDPRQANRVCIYGQLLILDLIEHLEPYCKLIQTNTDGIFITDYHNIEPIINEWQERTGLTLELTKATEIWQKDVNNYILKISESEYKTKGAYVKPLNPLDYGDYPIINKAIFEKLTKGTPISQTIYSNDNLIDYQMVVKISGKFTRIFYGERPLKETCVRIFAGHKSEPKIFKEHAETHSLFKIPNSPDNVFIENGDIHNKKVDSRLNREFYIELAKKRLEEFI